jgi:hypothetical protein
MKKLKYNILNKIKSMNHFAFTKFLAAFSILVFSTLIFFFHFSFALPPTNTTKQQNLYQLGSTWWHTYNSSYLGGKNWEDQTFRTVQAKS